MSEFPPKWGTGSSDYTLQKKKKKFYLFMLILAIPCGMWDLSYLTRDQTCTPDLEDGVLTPGSPGKSLDYLFSSWITWSKWKGLPSTQQKLNNSTWEWTIQRHPFTLTPSLRPRSLGGLPTSPLQSGLFTTTSSFSHKLLCLFLPEGKQSWFWAQLQDATVNWDIPFGLLTGYLFSSYHFLPLK